MSGYPEAIAQAGRIEPVPRRISEMVGDRMVLARIAEIAFGGGSEPQSTSRPVASS